jgi:hypothetical protein
MATKLYAKVKSIHSTPCYQSEGGLLMPGWRLTMTISPETCVDSMIAERMARQTLPRTHEHTIPLNGYQHNYDDAHQISSTHLATPAKAVSCKCGSNQLHTILVLAGYPMFCTDAVRRSEAWRNSSRSAVGDRRKWSESACPRSPRLVVWS